MINVQRLNAKIREWPGCKIQESLGCENPGIAWLQKSAKNCSHRSYSYPYPVSTLILHPAAVPRNKFSNCKQIVLL
jgi:hypothetical protein